MKFLAVVAAFFIQSATSQYATGGFDGVALPTNAGGSSSSSSWSSSSSSVVSNVQVPTFPNVNAGDLANLSVNGGANGSGSWAATSSTTIVNAKNELSTPVRSMNSLFTRFPSSTELGAMVDAGDIGAISKTLQTVAGDDSVPCGTKISYLLDLLGAVKDAVRRKTLVADQLASVIDGAKAEITRLTDEINRVQKDRDANQVPALDARVNDLSFKLSTLYNQINAVRTQIGPEQARIAGYERELQTVTRQNDDERNKITNDKIKLATTDSLIKDLEARLQEARDTRAGLQASITASENAIRDNQKKIDTIRQTIADIQAKIRGLQDTVDNLKRQTNTLEVDVERARTDLSVAKVRDDKFANDLRVLNDRLRNIQPTANGDDLPRLRALIANLNRVIPNINGDINREYYYCYGAGKVETQTVGSTVVYVVRGEAFGQYIQTAYGQSVGAPNVATGNDYRLHLVDPFSPVWTAKFGYPTLAGGVAGGAGGASWGATGGASWGSAGGWGSRGCGGASFGVGAASSAPAGWGTIAGVNADGFVVKNAKGETLSLNIGGCSRIESTSQVPQVGQSVAWRGTPSSAGGYSIYAATCW